MGTYIVGGLFIIMLFIIIRKLYKDKKNGKGCSKNCAACKKNCHHRNEK